MKLKVMYVSVWRDCEYGNNGFHIWLEAYNWKGFFSFRSPSAPSGRIFLHPVSDWNDWNPEPLGTGVSPEMNVVSPEMNVVGRHHIIEHAQTKAFLRLGLPALNLLNGSRT
jgi:hypothetical protein